MITVRKMYFVPNKVKFGEQFIYTGCLLAKIRVNVYDYCLIIRHLCGFLSFIIFLY